MIEIITTAIFEKNIKKIAKNELTNGKKTFSYSKTTNKGIYRTV